MQHFQGEPEPHPSSVHLYITVCTQQSFAQEAHILEASLAHCTDSQLCVTRVARTIYIHRI